MKFGKSLSNQIEDTLPEWRDKFLSYKELKKKVKLIERNSNESPNKRRRLDENSGDVVDAIDNSGDGDVMSREETHFLKLLEDELEKFNTFFVEKEEEYIIRLKELQDNVAKANDSTEKMIKIWKEIVDFHGEMVLLENYSVLNYTGLVKILKKYDKRTGALIRLPFIQRVLQQPFYTTDLLYKLVKECETMLEHVFPKHEKPASSEAKNVESLYMKSTISALRVLKEIRSGSSTVSVFSLPPLQIRGLDEAWKMSLVLEQAANVDEGMSFINRILTPTVTQCVLLLPLLARDRLFDEAWNYIKEHQIENSADVLRALLDGYRIHQQVTIKDMGLKPKSAYSWIEFRNKVHVFGTGVKYLVMFSLVQGQGSGLQNVFYSSSCPKAEAVVRDVCDGSVLISGSSTERSALPYLGLRGFEVIDDAKAQLESLCPGVVSCADILALAARDAVDLSDGPSWTVPSGRRDGRVSSSAQASSFPSPLESIAAQRQKFAAKGLTDNNLVTLVVTGSADSTINQSFLAQLQALCPRNGDGSKKVALDINSQMTFDVSFYKNVCDGKGVLESDRQGFGEMLLHVVLNQNRVKTLIDREEKKTLFRIISQNCKREELLRKLSNAYN
ncbi:SPX domain-containing protein 1 [Hibiscus syriacus]|uniref:SPX domain-containing protein 1 n=1 Tax=Hibiscus syriacus TaxID=106335 RepID=A0A6A2YUK1_HIBSY|nr:SPX domain-containing protein 1 [Hibiscus syriacus]